MKLTGRNRKPGLQIQKQTIYIYMKVQTVPHSKHAPSLLRLMLYREMMVWLPANHTKPINTVCGQKVEFLNVKAGST